MFSKTYKLVVLFLLIGFSSFSQINDNKPFQITPYLGLSSPSSGLKDFAESGSVFGISVDKYISSKFALGIDLNFQSNSFSSPFDFSGITSPYNVTESANGKWNATAFTFGPTYKLRASKFNAELYTKFGLLYIKSPDARAIFNHSVGTKEIFNLPEQKRTGFGLTSGIRLNYQVSKKLSLFLNPQYVYGSAKVEYCDCGVSGSSNPDDILEAESVKKTFSPSYLNVNAGLTFSLGGNKEKTETQTSVNRNLPFCDIEFVELECNSTSQVLKFTMIWSGYAPSFTRTVEVYNGNTLINPATANPQALSQNYGSVPFYVPIQSNLIGTSLNATIRIFDLNNNEVCTKSIPFTVPACSPQPPSCNFDIDMENVVCDVNTITYSATSSWSNLMIGSVVDLIVVDQSGNTISPITVTPNSFPISITSANATGSLSNTISIPFSYNNTPINIFLQFEDPTTGAINQCSFSDLFTPNCNNSTPTCGWDYNITCDNATNSVKIDVSSTWSNVPNGSFLDFELINGNASVGGNIAFTSIPNSFPMAISGTGSITNSLLISGYPTGNPFVFKMKIIDANGTVLCEQGIDEYIPECSFKTCDPREVSAKCENGIVTVDFEVPWTNFNQFANLYVFAEIYDSNQNLVQALPAYALNNVNGVATFAATLPQQYAGTTIEVRTWICKQGQPIKSCDCLKKLKIEIPKCCQVCDGISIIDNTDVVNQKGEGWFKLFWNVAPIVTTSVNKINIELESFGADNSTTNQVLPNPNFEITGAGISTPSITYNAIPVGSLNNDRSNLWIINFPITPFTGGDLVIVIGEYNKKIINNYKLKVTLFKQDGTYCERTIQYTR